MCLSHAVANRDVAEVKRLLKADVFSKCSNHNSETPLMISTYMKSTTITKLIVDSGRVDIDETDDEGWTALMWSARYAGSKSTTAILKTLIDAGASLDLIANNGWTALMMAAHYSAHESSEEAVRLLLEAGADPGVARPGDGWTALIFAVRGAGTHGTLNTVKMLANWPDTSSSSSSSSNDPGDINYRDNNDMTALMHAIGKPDVIKVLLESPLCDPNVQQEDGHTALMLAILLESDANIKSIKMLLKHPDIDVNVQDEKGNTALIIAVLCNSLMITTALINHPDTDLNVENNDVKSALSLARDKNIVKLLVNNPDIILVPCDLIHGLDTKPQDTIKVLIAAYKKANLLNGQCPSNGDTALIHVTKKNNLPIQKQLLDAGADVTVKNSQEETAWMIARANGFPTAQLEAALDKVAVHHTEEPPPAYSE